MSQAASYDYIVIGAGSAGCVVASRLTEDPDVTVLVLEAGHDGLLDIVADPPLWPTLGRTERDWAYETVMQSATGHVHDIPRGRGLGGSHSINAMAFMRGHRTDFDSWAYAGNPGWAYDQVLPYFKRMEHVPHGDPHHRGRGGPLQVGPTARPHPLTLAFVEACQQAGHPRRQDFNCGELDGTGLHDMTILDGQRQTTADAYVRPVISRPNLTVQMGAFVHRLVVHHGRCAGVEYRCGGQRHHAQAEGEVVLCAGAIDSPRLLLLSGIGDPKQLSGLGIEPVTGLPGVGHNFHDHVLLRGICVEARQPIPPATGNLGEAVLYWRSDARLTGPNLQIVLVYAPFYNPWQKATSNAYTFAVAHMRPASRGRLSLVSSDPRDRPRIDPNYLSDRHDLEMLIEGVQKAVELSAQPAFAEWRGGDAISGIGAAEPRTLADFVKSGVSTFNHAVGTCRMGVDEYSVVDPQLKVHDLEGLRVADASVMPSVTTTNTNAATIMIGEKTADLIRQESGHVPVVVSPGPD